MTDYSRIDGYKVQFSQELAVESPLGVILRGHLYIEAALARAIEPNLAFPHLLDIERLAFGQKVGLAAALGFVPEEAVPAFQRLNKIRNRLAHRLDVQVSEQDQQDLRRAMSAAMRRRTQSVGDLKESLIYIIVTLLMTVEQAIEAHWANDEAIRADLREGLRLIEQIEGSELAKKRYKEAGAALGRLAGTKRPRPAPADGGSA